MVEFVNEDGWNKKKIMVSLALLHQFLFIFRYDHVLAHKLADDCVFGVYWAVSTQWIHKYFFTAAENKIDEKIEIEAR